MDREKSLYKRLKNNRLAISQWERREEPFETYSNKKILEDLRYYADPFNNIFEQEIKELAEEIERWSWIIKQPSESSKKTINDSLRQAQKDYAQIKRILKEYA